MAFPVDVTLREVTFGPAFDLTSGAPLAMKVTFTPSRSMVRGAPTGSPGVAREYSVTTEEGMEGSITIPVTDQVGWFDGNGNAISTDAGGNTHSYRVRVSYLNDQGREVGSPPAAKSIALPTGDGTPVDLDALIPVTTTGGVTVSVPDSWSADVAAAAASAAAAEAALSDADTLVADNIADTGSATRASLNATYDAKGATSAGLTRRFGPSFTAHPGAQVTHDASDLNSIYAPWVIKTEGIIPGALGAFYMYYSTDHDTGAGGIGLAYANSPTGPWTVHKPGGNPVIYVDAVDGDQTETPAVLYVPDDPDGKPLYMYYQQEGPSGGLNQSTALAKSADGITWTRVGLVIIGRSTWQGDGQTTYFRPFRVGDLFIGWHLIGGGDYGTTGISYSRDGLTWVTDPRRLGYFVDVLGGNTGRVMLRSVFQWRGEPWGLYGQEPYSSGFAGGSGKAFLTAKLTPDLRRFQGNTAEVFASLPSGVTEVDLWGHVIEHNGNLYMYYRANGAYGDIRVAVAEA